MPFACLRWNFVLDQPSRGGSDRSFHDSGKLRPTGLGRVLACGSEKGVSYAKGNIRRRVEPRWLLRAQESRGRLADVVAGSGQDHGRLLEVHRYRRDGAKDLRGRIEVDERKRQSVCRF